MDTMERYKIEESIRDVIAILDSALTHRDLIPETNIVHLTNRAPIAHLAIERGLKALIATAGHAPDPIHDLNKLYKYLQDCDIASAEFLDQAFKDAVKFFRYNVKLRGFGHFRSLHSYLAKVGTNKAFEALRYWAIGQASIGKSPISYISVPIHRELLCALASIFVHNPPETVSERIEREVAASMFERRHVSYSTEDPTREQAVGWYIRWLSQDHLTCSRALRAAIQQNFSICGNEYINQTVSDAYKELQKSKDPATRYHLHTLTYLPKGSQQKISGAVCEIEWLNEAKSYCVVRTPAGTDLGYLRKQSDGAWAIEPSESGFVRDVAVAEALLDAKAYLVNRLTRQATLFIDGSAKELRVICRNDWPFGTASVSHGEELEVLDLNAMTYEIEFWSDGHGVSPGDGISVRIPSDDSPFPTILTGEATSVTKQTVSIAGQITLGSVAGLVC